MEPGSIAEWATALFDFLGVLLLPAVWALYTQSKTISMLTSEVTHLTQTIEELKKAVDALESSQANMRVASAEAHGEITNRITALEKSGCQPTRKDKD